jgi:hypothetical protein
MSEEDYEDSPNALRATRKSERREKQHQHEQEGPVVARYGVWTGEGYLREGEGLEKRVAEQSVKVEGQTRRDKRRRKKKK